MSMTFYYAPMSTATITQLVIAELGIPCESVKVDIKKGETKKSEFLKLNPNGKVPVFVHDGMVMWESCAITMYLGETFGVEKHLYPAAGPKRGEAMKWLTWAHVTLGDAVGRWTRNTTEWVPAEQHNAKAGEVGMADMHACLKILDGSLDGKQYLLGEYSLVDTHLNSFVDWLRMMKVDMAGYAHLNAWGKRCCARPAYAKVMTAGV